MLDKITHWLELGGLPVLFLLIFLEGNPLIGSFIPGQILVIFIGFIISTTHTYNIYLTIFLVFIGAFLGDLIGFYIGRKLGNKGIEKLGLTDNNLLYKSSKSFFKKYGTFAIFLGRQVNPTRAFIPFLAGTCNVKKYKFVSVAFISCAFWSIISIYLGYFFGNIIVYNFKFFIEFLIVFAMYILFLLFTYKRFNFFVKKNIHIVKKHSLYNVFFLGLLSIIFTIFCVLSSWNYDLLFNECFSFIFFPSLYMYFGFLFSNFYLFIIIPILFLLYKKEFRLSIVFSWGGIFLIFYLLIIKLFLINFFNVNLYVSIIVVIYMLFILWIISKKYLSKKKQYFFNVISIILLIFIVLIKFSQESNLFSVILSLLVACIFCEILLILSNYQILDRELSELQY